MFGFFFLFVFPKPSNEDFFGKDSVAFGFVEKGNVGPEIETDFFFGMVTD